MYLLPIVKMSNTILTIINCIYTHILYTYTRIGMYNIMYIVYIYYVYYIIHRYFLLMYNMHIYYIYIPKFITV